MEIYKKISWASSLLYQKYPQNLIHYLGLMILILGIICTFLQANEDLNRSILQNSDIKNLNLLFDKFKSSFKNVAEEKTVKGKIAVAEVDVSTLNLSAQSAKELQNYIVKQLEKSTYEISLDLKKIDQTNSPTIFVSSPNFISKETNAFKLKKKIAQNVGAKNYVDIKLSLVDEVWYLNATLRTLPHHKIAWQSVWSQLYDDTDSWVQFSFGAGYAFDSKEIPLVFDVYFFKRPYGFFEWGANVGAGASFFSLNSANNTSKQRTYFQFNIAPKLGLALFELTKSNYSGVDLLLNFKTGFKIIYILNSNVPINKELDVHFVLTPGLTILFGQHFLVGLDFEIMDKQLLLNFGFRF